MATDDLNTGLIKFRYSDVNYSDTHCILTKNYLTTRWSPTSAAE